jgi:carbon storage regulator CsrA
MLVLSRQKDQIIRIGDDIVITVVDVRIEGKKTVRLGITAPKDVSVWRGEIYPGPSAPTPASREPDTQTEETSTP